MYQPRSIDELTPLAGRLAERGILGVNDVYSVAELAQINSIMSPIFAAKSSEPRAYVRPDEMLTVGLLDKVLSRRMRDLILSVVPDPVLYHFHAYEIAANSTKSHIFGDNLSGWHRDGDSEYFRGDPTHVSIFVYLSNVGEDDGAFEFSPHTPDQPLRTESPMMSMLGPAGMSFLWHRRYYHRAAPNRGLVRRRLIKISVQPNQFQSQHLSQGFFAKVVKDAPKGDPEFDMLLGRYQGRPAPKLKPSRPVAYFDLSANKPMGLPEDVIAKMKKREIETSGMPVAYD